MKKLVTTICMMLSLSVILNATLSQAADKKQTHHVGLHDRLVDFTDVRVIDGDMKVPLDEIARVLYISVEQENDITYIRKRGIEISYNDATQQIVKDGIEISWSPIVNVNGKLFISVKYIARETGFKTEHIRKLQTLRIYRDDYAHMSHADYEKKLHQLLDKKKPTVSHIKPSKKSAVNVYLTFDDGPNEFTTINNATLKKYNVQGSFFFLGKHMKNHENIVKEVASAGHYIGTHSMTHDKNKLYKSPKAFIKEMNEGTKLILQMTGHDAKLLRVPYGSKPHITPAMQQQLNKHNYKIWDWDVDSNDWKYTDKQADEITKNVRTGVEKSYQSGDRDIIILLHDRSQTTKALPQIIEWLQQEGYNLKTYEPKQHIIQNFLNDTTL